MTEEVQKQRVRVGADPEVFVRNAGGKVIPVCGLVGGTKDFPKPLPTNRRWVDESVDNEGMFAVQEDGVAMEFNIPAVTSASNFIVAIEHAMKECRRIAKSRKLELVISPSSTFEAVQLEDPRACTVGCLADKDAYGAENGTTREPFSAVDFGTDRFCGGHLHLGYNKDNVPANVMARYVDLFVGLPSVFHDKQGPRRKYYGQAGLYREKDYGIEYRTLSNFWLRDNHRSDDTNYLYYLAQTLFDLGLIANTKHRLLAEAYANVPWADVKECINTENTTLATELYAFATSVLRLPIRYWKELTQSRDLTDADRVQLERQRILSELQSATLRR